jgi:hypothetical protein
MMAQEPRPHVAGGSSCAIHIVNFLGTYQKTVLAGLRLKMVRS